MILLASHLFAMSMLWSEATTRSYDLSSTKGLKVIGGTLATAEYKGRKSVLLTQTGMTDGIAIVGAQDFKNGTIDFDIAGMPIKGTTPDVRGFVGIAFRISPDNTKFEIFYLRETNGRSDDQERRNHAVQYCSPPAYSWKRLRGEKPFRYEAYTDLEVGAWTHVHIEVQGTEAQFYVGRASQPCLVVHDLLLGETHGKIGLWVGDQSQAYYANLRVVQS